MIFDIAECEKIIGYTFKDKMLLRKCFTHSSYSHEHGGENNELLEFFGDAVIEFIVTEYLYTCAYGDEGKLTAERAQMVAKAPLLEAIGKLKLDEYMLLGNGLAGDGSKEEKLYSSLYEALAAGIYLDGGMTAVKKFVKNTIIKNYEEKRSAAEIKKRKEKGAKMLLQEHVQGVKLGSIAYELLGRTGPDHKPEFRSAVLLNGERLAEGKGKSKKAAETAAAESALKKLKRQGGKK